MAVALTTEPRRTSNQALAYLLALVLLVPAFVAGWHIGKALWFHLIL